MGVIPNFGDDGCGGVVGHKFGKFFREQQGA
jgi:hypothetical protein